MNHTKSLFFNFRADPCVRILENNIRINELHPCFFCGYSIPVGKLVDCPNCGLKVCPSCSRCLCGSSDNEIRTLVWVHSNYCRNREKLLHFSGLDPCSGDENIIKNANQALTYCSRLFRAGNSYEFTKGLLNPGYEYFGHDISKWFRYSLFGLKHFPATVHSALDIGPGEIDGPTVYHIGRPNSVIYCLDARAPDSLPDWVRWTVGDMSHLTDYYPKNHFGLVSCFETIEHVEKSTALNVLNQIVDLLEPGGTFVVSTPNRTGKHSGGSQGIHVYEWSYGEMLFALSERFDVVKTYGNRVDLSWTDLSYLTDWERSLVSELSVIVPLGIISNLVSINHPEESLISVFVGRKKT